MKELDGAVHVVPTCVGSLRVRVTGSGPGAVLWHSLFVDSRSWYRVEAAMAAQRTLVIIDGPSHGGSQPAQQLFTLEDCAAAAVTVLDHLGMTAPVDWVGSAWGGHVGMILAVGLPERIRSLVTLASPVAALSGAERARILPLVGAYRTLGPAGFLRAAVADALLTPAIRAEIPETGELVSDALLQADRQGMTRAMRSVMLRRPDLSDLLPSIAVPTLVMTGDDDPLWTAASAHAAASRMGHAEAVVVAGSRHLPALEAPEEVVRRITAFWASVGGEVTDGPAAAGGPASVK